MGNYLVALPNVLEPRFPYCRLLMTVAGVNSHTAGNPSAGVTAVDDTIVFQKMIEGLITTGMSLANGFIGDAIDTISESDDGS